MILITGANGQLGRAIQNECVGRGIRILPTDFFPEGNRKPNAFPNGLLTWISRISSN